MRTRAPVKVPESPPVWTSEPSLRESSVSLAMASRSACGGGPWFSAAFTIERNRMYYSPRVSGFDTGLVPRALPMRRARGLAIDRGLPHRPARARDAHQWPLGVVMVQPSQGHSVGGWGCTSLRWVARRTPSGMEVQELSRFGVTGARRAGH